MTGWFEVVDVWENGQVQLKINKQFAPFCLSLKIMVTILNIYLPILYN